MNCEKLLRGVFEPMTYLMNYPMVSVNSDISLLKYLFFWVHQLIYMKKIYILTVLNCLVVKEHNREKFETEKNSGSNFSESSYLSQHFQKSLAQFHTGGMVPFSNS